MKFLNFPVLTPLAADPGTPAAGTLYVNSTAGLKWFNSSWSTAMDLESAQTASGTKTFGTINVTTLSLTNALTQAKTHASPDTDTATTALHHTLGTGANQAAAGNHTHDAAAIATGTLPILRGGTNSTATPTAGTVAYGAGTAYAFTAAGQANQVLISNGASAPTWATLDLTYLPGSWAKKAVVTATTANITLSGTQTIDGIAVVAGDRVLVKDQTSTQNNGIYIVAAGAWTRAPDADSSAEIAGAMVNIDGGVGSTQAGQAWRTYFRPVDTLGTTSMFWARVYDSQMGGQSNGIATLDSLGDVPMAQLPVAASGSTSSTQIVRADDVRLSDARLPSNDTSLVHLAGAETITGPKIIQLTSDAVSLHLKARTSVNGGQTTDLLRTTDPDGNVNAYIDALGNVRAFNIGGPLGSMQVTGAMSVTGALSAPGATDISGAWSTYTCTWSAATTAPTIGNGTITAEYKQIGKTVFVRILIQRGSTTTAGAGAYTFSLPVAGLYPGCVGSAFFACNNVVYGGQCGLVNSTNFGIFNGSTRIASATPAAWVAADYISASIVYRAA